MSNWSEGCDEVEAVPAWVFRPLVRTSCFGACILEGGSSFLGTVACFCWAAAEHFILTATVALCLILTGQGVANPVGSAVITLGVGRSGVKDGVSEDDECACALVSALSEDMNSGPASLLLCIPGGAHRVFVFRDLSSSLQSLFGQGLAHPH